MSSDTNSVIVWKKRKNRFRCILNNCYMTEGYKLSTWKKEIDYGDLYDKVMEEKFQSVQTLDNKILLYYIPEDIIIEIKLCGNVQSQMLSIISHKIRTPMTNILGVLNWVNKSNTSNIDKSNLKILKKSCFEIMGTANDIIDILNLKRGEMKLNKENVGLKKLLNKCRDIVTLDLKEKNLKLVIEIGKNVPNIINVDASKLEQVIICLLNNSIQFTSTGGISINIEIFDKTMTTPFTFDENNDVGCNLLFSIKDSGSGMNEAKKTYVQHILGIKNSDSVQEYAGLGLIISKYICNLMKGKIWFDTSQNIGTIFYFNIVCE